MSWSCNLHKFFSCDVAVLSLYPLLSSLATMFPIYFLEALNPVTNFSPLSEIGMPSGSWSWRNVLWAGAKPLVLFSPREKAFVLEDSLGTFHSDYFCPLSDRTTEGSFSGLHHEQMMCVCGVVHKLKFMKMWVSPCKTVGPGVYHSHAGSHVATSHSSKLTI